MKCDKCAGRGYISDDIGNITYCHDCDGFGEKLRDNCICYEFIDEDDFLDSDNE